MPDEIVPFQLPWHQQAIHEATSWLCVSMPAWFAMHLMDGNLSFIWSCGAVHLAGDGSLEASTEHGPAGDTITPESTTIYARPNFGGEDDSSSGIGGLTGFNTGGLPESTEHGPAGDAITPASTSIYARPNFGGEDDSSSSISIGGLAGFSTAADTGTSEPVYVPYAACLYNYPLNGMRLKMYVVLPCVSVCVCVWWWWVLTIAVCNLAQVCASTPQQCAHQPTQQHL